MKNPLIALLFSLYPIFLNAQQLNELKKVLDEAKSDTARIDVCIKLGNYYERANIDSGIYYTEKAVELAQEIEDEKRYVSALRILGILHGAKGDFTKAMGLLEKAANIASSHGYLDQEASTYNNMGFLYTNLGDYPKAINLYTKALKGFEKVKDLQQLSFVYNNISMVYLNKGDFEEALLYQRKSLKIKNEASDSVSMTSSYYNIGRTFYGMKKYQEATKALNTSLTISRELGIPQGIFFNLSMLALVKEAQGEYDEAITLLKEIQKEEKKFGKVDIQVETFLQLGKVYRSAQNYQKAKENLEKGILGADTLELMANLARGLSELAPTYAALGDFEKAYQTHQRLKSVSDSLFNEEQTKEITRLEEDYKFDRERQEMQTKEQVLKEEKAKQELLTAIALIALIALLVIALLIYRQSKLRAQTNTQLRSKNTEISTQREEIRQQAEELQTANDKLISLDRFKEQMTGMIVHDLKSPLNTILLLTNDLQNERLQMAHQASHQMLNLVMNMLDVQKFADTKVELNVKPTQAGKLFERALGQVKLSAKLQNLSFEIEGKESLLYVDQELVLRLLVNLLTNAIRYAPESSVIYLSAEYQSNDEVRLSVKDQGKGIPKDQQTQIFERFGQTEARKGATGLGLTFCKLVAEAHGGAIGVNSEVNQGSKFWVRLPKGEGGELLEKDVFDSDDETILFQLSEKDKKDLKPLILELQTLDVYQATRIYEALDQFPMNLDHESISGWNEQLRQAVYACNEARYEELLNLISPRK